MAISLFKQIKVQVQKSTSRERAIGATGGTGDQNFNLYESQKKKSSLTENKFQKTGDKLKKVNSERVDRMN
jgi:hypothetical protein